MCVITCKHPPITIVGLDHVSTLQYIYTTLKDLWGKCSITPSLSASDKKKVWRCLASFSRLSQEGALIGARATPHHVWPRPCVCTPISLPSPSFSSSGGSSMGERENVVGVWASVKI